MNIPEELVMRSARARAAASGTDVEEVLAAWAGGAPAPAGATAPAPETEPTPDEEPEAEQPEQTAAPAPATPAPEPAAQPPAAGTVTPVPTPATVTPEEALAHDVVVTVPTAGLKERTSTTIPQWLVAALLVIPVFGLLYLAGNGTADATCEESGVVLRVDRASGALVNCDGSEFTGRGGGGGDGGQFIALGSEVYATCAGCHGANGGGGTGPAFGGVLLTFGGCADHIEWVRLGSAGFQADGRSTYGDTGKSIGGGMPGFASLTDEELASVVAFERIRFGGGSADEVLTDCGLVEAALEEGAAGEGEAPDGAGSEEMAPAES